MAKRATRNYVNNPDFLEALVQYQKSCREAEDAGDDRPRVPDYIGTCIFQIGTRLATKPNFSGYSYKEDMISDGIENCLLYINNFNPEKSSNPFAYFTQIIWYAFLRRIAKEKKQMYIRFKSSQHMIATGGTYTGDGVDLNLNTSADYMNDFVRDFEDKLAKDKAKKKETEAAKKLEEEARLSAEADDSTGDET
jgi:DNA-directed RNA polymerase specialized sigma24 family protein|tara:strand:- start:122 stop:703 length:582 start_codon:yes stop_codon:yes gene_type:complete